MQHFAKHEKMSLIGPYIFKYIEPFFAEKKNRMGLSTGVFSAKNTSSFDFIFYLSRRPELIRVECNFFGK